MRIRTNAGTYKRNVHTSSQRIYMYILIHAHDVGYRPTLNIGQLVIYDVRHQLVYIILVDPRLYFIGAS